MKAYFLALSLTIFMVPSVALAAWWNPLSWFGGSQALVPEQASSTKSANNQTQGSVNSQPIVQEKTVVKTVTVDNPELQKKIDDLNQRLTDESGQLIQMTTQYNNLLDKYNKTIQGDNAFASAMQSIVTTMAMECKKQPVYVPYVPSVSSFTPFSCTSDNIGGSTYTYCR